jgi:hypothetical protein
MYMQYTCVHMHIIKNITVLIHINMFTIINYSKNMYILKNIHAYHVHAYIDILCVPSILLAYTYIHNYMHIHTYTHTYMQTLYVVFIFYLYVVTIYTYIHIYIHTNIHTHTHTHTYIHT